MEDLNQLRPEQESGAKKPAPDDVDDIIIFYKDGKYKIIRVQDKIFVGKNIQYVNVFKRNDKRTVYNVVYRDGLKGPYFLKRFYVASCTRDKEYDLTQGKPQSRIMYLTGNPNGEAERFVHWI